MKFLVDLMFGLAATDTAEQCLEIVAYGDKHLGNDTCADRELVEELVLVATNRLETLRKGNKNGQAV